MHDSLEEIYSYPITTSDIVLNDLKIGKEYKATINLVYDIGGISYKRTELANISFMPDVSRIVIGQFIIWQYTNTLENFSFSQTNEFVKKELLRFSSGEKTLYIKESKDYFKPLIIGFFLMVGGFSIPFSIRYYKSKRKNRFN